jgi:hypothetical protein
MQDYQKERKLRIELEALLGKSESGELLDVNRRLEKENEELKAQLKVLMASHRVSADRTPKQAASPRRLAQPIMHHQPHQPYCKYSSIFSQEAHGIFVNRWQIFLVVIGVRQKGFAFEVAGERHFEIGGAQDAKQTEPGPKQAEAV